MFFGVRNLRFLGVNSSVKTFAKRFVWLSLYALFWAGLWQLDMICASQIWSREWYWMLPFNIPIHVQYAYCLFYAWIILSAHILIVWGWDFGEKKNSRED